MDAIRFRQKAARAREMAQSGDDVRLSRMLLEVAIDLDEEAEAMEAQAALSNHMSRDQPGTEKYGALLHNTHNNPDNPVMGSIPVEIVSLSVGGVKFRIARALKPGSRMTLELSKQAIRLDGIVVSIFGTETTMVFDSSSSADPALSRLLQPQWVAA